ncbi:hypothetical protein DRW48_10225 [Paracoccus suum]|uniref:Ceramidase n=1 Tax=Paracoccus suum TaxID=2259340 RepID=A0A344PKW2_9RHOB|nr:ceramidase domain-containing protein [Paracoccus suum]AXC50017.1 hypothetical protein DRW48_10225 [Paracoccus suum]
MRVVRGRIIWHHATMLSVLLLTTPVDIYCERTSAAFWSEPVNAVTNLSFIAAGLWGVATARSRGERSPAVWLLIALAFAIGIGSFLFHTVAQVWSSFADTIPIWIFVALACGICAVRIGGWRPGRVVIGALILAALAAVLIASGDGSGGRDSGPPALNGSLQYAPAVVALAAFAALAQWRGHPLRWWITGALATFLVSLTARTFDQAVCGAFPLGLHWIWHLMNGVLIGLVLQIVLRAAPPGVPRTPAQPGIR